MKLYTAQHRAHAKIAPHGHANAKCQVAHAYILMIVSEGRRHAEKPEASSVGMPWGAFHCMPGLASVLADAGVRRAVALARARGGCTVEGRPQRDPDELRTVARCKRTQRRASLRFSLADARRFGKCNALFGTDAREADSSFAAASYRKIGATR